MQFICKLKTSFGCSQVFARCLLLVQISLLKEREVTDQLGSNGKISFASKKNIKQGHQIPDTEISPKPVRGTSEAKNIHLKQTKLRHISDKTAHAPKSTEHHKKGYGRRNIGTETRNRFTQNVPEIHMCCSWKRSILSYYCIFFIWIYCRQ